MKNIILAACVAAFSVFTHVQAQTVTCDECHTYTVLTGTMPESRMLSASTKYLISGCYVVPNGVTLTIPPGTQLFGDVTTKGMLIVDRGGTLIANGTNNNPIIFTSCREQGEREPGDWGGIAIFGNATNNVSGGEISVTRCSTAYIGGHATTFVDNDNSGSLQYVQIHFAGEGNPGDDYVNGLVLVSVGSGTTLEHIQVSHSLTNGFAFAGGTVNGKYLVGYNNILADFETILGYGGNMQFGLSFRADPAYHNVGGSNGFRAANNNIIPGYTGMPLTRPVASNFSFIGPDYCDESELSATFHHGLLLEKRTAGGIYNSIVTGWPRGLLISDTVTIENANNGLLKYSYNTFYGYPSSSTEYSFANSATWNLPPAACTNNMDDWMQNTDAFLTCAPLGYQSLSLFDNLGYGDLCQDFCTTPPDFSLGSSDLDNATFTDIPDLDNPFFETDNEGIDFRGAFGSTDWTADWTDWCPVETDYCPEQLQRSRRTEGSGRLNIVPNPASGTAYVLFDAGQTGKMQVNVLDKVSGQALLTVNGSISNTGTQRIAIPVSGLHTGIYIVKVILPDGSLLNGQLFVL